MKSVLAALVSIPALGGLVGALLLAAVIWFFAPALLGVNSLWLLLLLTALPVLVWVIVMVWLVRRRQRRDELLVAGATQVSEQNAKASAAAAAASESEQLVSQRLKDALAAMKAAGGGKSGYLYERPWYVFIGPPAAGKTTAIEASGLDFPLATTKIVGVGGTRNCEWWIAEQAVLIDTAGRYTTQDSDAAADKAEWEKFLDLLRRHRPRQPLNGIVVAFGADMLNTFDQAERQLNAQAVRRRIRELEQRLGQRLPVYFILCKTDLLRGFSEFFDDLDRDGRGQVWGMTFPPESTVEGQVGRFGEEFAALLQGLQNRLLERLQAERGSDQRARIAGFPTQFASLEVPLAAFIKAAFGGSKLDPAPFLRGVYFASGTQEGTPIDRLTGALSRAFGLDPQRPAAVMGQKKGKSYFISRFLRDLVFNEARLAARDRGQERRNRLIQIGAWTAALLIVIAGGALAWKAMRAESIRADNVTAALGRSDTSARGLPLERITATDDLLRVLPYLDNARELPTAPKGDSGGLGLSQQAKLTEAGKSAYAHALDRVLLPRLLARLEAQMRAGMQRPEYLYEATRVYLTLGRLGPLDAPLVKEWMVANWAQEYPGAVAAPVRDGLASHLDGLLKTDFTAYPVDGALVDQARRVFSRLPMAERVYSRLRSVAGDIPPWRPADALGLAGQRLFVLASGKPLAQAAVPGLYTVEGLHRALLPRLPQAIREAASESWVLGPEAAAALTVDPRQLESSVLRLYADEYVKSWQAMLGDLVLAPFKGLPQAAEALNLLGAPNSPMRDLLASIAKQLSPGTPPPAPAPASAAASAIGGLASAVAGAASQALASSRISQVIGAPAQPSSAAVVAQVVEEKFRPLREVAGAPLAGIMATLNQMYEQIARMASAPPGAPGGAPTGGLDPAQRLASQAELAPEPLSRWLTVAAQSSGAIRSGGARASIAAAAAQQLVPFCRSIETRFPFRRDPAAPDMPMDDFARLFSPGGVFDQFFAQTLRNYVDTNQRPWRPFAADGAPSPVSPSDIAQFQRAAAIRDAFFPASMPGQQGAGLRFELMPLGLDTGARSATLEVEGMKVSIAPGTAMRPVQLQWPSRGPVSLAFEPASSAGVLANDGAWAALKFIARGRLSAINTPDRFRLSLQQGERSAEFELRAASIVNPFALRELAEFRCPQMAP